MLTETETEMSKIVTTIYKKDMAVGGVMGGVNSIMTYCWDILRGDTSLSLAQLVRLSSLMCCPLTLSTMYRIPASDTLKGIKINQEVINIQIYKYFVIISRQLLYYNTIQYIETSDG